MAIQLKERFDLPLSLILIDSLVAAAGYTREGQDNDAALLHTIMMTAAKVSHALRCFTFVIDHYGKDTQVGTRGSSVKEGDADVILACLGGRTDSGEVVNSRLALRKLRSGPSGEEFPFRGKVVEIVDPKTKKKETTLIIDWWTDPEPAGSGKPKRNEWGKSKAVKLLRKIVMELLVDCGEQIRPFADGPLVRALKLKLVQDEFFKSYPAPTDTDEAARKHARRMAFNRALEYADDKVVTREIDGNDYIWLSQKGPGETPGETVEATGRRPTRPPPIQCKCGCMNASDAVECAHCKAQLQGEGEW